MEVWRATVYAVRREFSAGGVLVRRLRKRWVLAAIRPAGRPPGHWVLPKGAIEEGESAQVAALREIAEETGTRGRVVSRLGRVDYWFGRDGERVLKSVTFFLVRYAGGRLGRLPEAFRHEVAAAAWLPVADAPALLAYRGEREMAERAHAMLAAGHDV